MTREKENLTEGWPDEPGQGELAEFAEKLRADRPRLAPQALDNVAAALRREISAQQHARRNAWLWFSLAATVLLAAGLYSALRSVTPPVVPKTEEIAQTLPPTPPTQITDHYSVEFAPLQAAGAPQRPLLSTEKYRSLYQEL